MKTPQSPAPVAGEEDAIILEMCKAHDREESAQKGEPSPWDERFERDFDWEQERFFAMREAFDVAKVALSRPASEQPVEAIGAGREVAQRLREAAEQQRDCSVCDGDGEVQRHDPPYGLRKCGGCDGTGKRHVLPSQLRQDILAALSPASPARTPMGGPQVLKGVGKINGDGWKDTTSIGEVVYVWNAEKPSPYAPGQYPRIWNEGWSASTAQYDFSPASIDEVRALAAPTPMGGEVEALREAASGVADALHDAAHVKTRNLEAAITNLADLKVIAFKAATALREALAASSPSPAQGGITGQPVADAFIAGFMFAVGRQPWDDMHDYAAVIAIDYAAGKPLPERPASPSAKPAEDKEKAAYQRGWNDRESDIIERAERIAPQADALAVLDRLLTHSGARGSFDAMKHGDAVKEAEALLASNAAQPAEVTQPMAWPEVTDAWAETYCELTGRDPDGQQVTFVDGGTVTTFRDMAKREIEAMLCAAPKSAVRAIAAPTPMGGEVEALLREAAGALLKQVDGVAARIGWGDYGERERLRQALALAAPTPMGDSAGEDTGRQAIWTLVHEVWQLLDDAETNAEGVTTPDQERWQAVSEAMDALEALVPESEGPFWGGFPVNYLWPKGAATSTPLSAEAARLATIGLYLTKGRSHVADDGALHIEWSMGDEAQLHEDAEGWALEEEPQILAALAAPTPMGGEVEALRETAKEVRALCNGHPHAKIAWPHRELHAIADKLEALAASSPSPAQGGMAAPPSVQPVEGK